MTFEQLKQKLENKGYSLVLTVPPEHAGMYIKAIHYFEYPRVSQKSEVLVVEENIFGMSFYQKMSDQNREFFLQALEAA